MLCLIQLNCTFLTQFFLSKLKIDFTNFLHLYFLHLYFSKQTLSDRCFEPQQQQELSNPHRILLLILRGGRRALETSHRRPSTRCAERLCWSTAACEPRVCGFKNSFYSVELRTACHKDSPLFSFFISEFLTRLFSKQQHIMNSSLSSLVLQFWNVKKSGELSPTMNQPKYLWAIMACMCFCTGLTWAAPKKNNKKSSDHNSDLIPIPDDLLENYNMPSGKPKFQYKKIFFSWIQFHEIFCEKQTTHISRKRTIEIKV